MFILHFYSRKSDVEAAEPRDVHEAAADIEMSDKTIRTKDPLAKLCRKCAKPKYAKKHSSECDAAVCFGFAASMEVIYIHRSLVHLCIV